MLSHNDPSPYDTLCRGCACGLSTFFRPPASALKDLIQNDPIRHEDTYELTTGKRRPPDKWPGPAPTTWQPQCRPASESGTC